MGSVIRGIGRQLFGTVLGFVTFYLIMFPVGLLLAYNAHLKVLFITIITQSHGFLLYVYEFLWIFLIFITSLDKIKVPKSWCKKHYHMSLQSNKCVAKPVRLFEKNITNPSHNLCANKLWIFLIFLTFQIFGYWYGLSIALVVSIIIGSIYMLTIDWVKEVYSHLKII